MQRKHGHKIAKDENDTYWNLYKLNSYVNNSVTFKQQTIQNKRLRRNLDITIKMILSLNWIEKYHSNINMDSFCECDLSANKAFADVINVR